MRAAIVGDDGTLPDDLTGLQAALYERVSTLDKGERARKEARSINQQHRDNILACEMNQWVITGRYQDPGLSASRFATKPRPDHIRLLQDIAARKFDVVVLWEPSRGDRKLPTWAGFLEMCRDNNVLIYITYHRRVYNMRNSRDWQSLAEEGIDAVMETERHSRRCKRGQDDSARAGIPHGYTPYGYERVYDPRSGELTGQQERGPDEDDIAAGRPGHADLIREIITRNARGMGPRPQALDLNGRSIPGPMGGEWFPDTIRRICLNPVYIGKRRHKSELYDAIWPALADEDVFWAGVSLLQGRRTGKRPGGVKYLLSYSALCAECGDILQVFPYRGHTGDRRTMGPFYACRIKGCVAIYVDQMDRYVELAVFERCARPDLYPLSLLSNDRAAIQAWAEHGELKNRLEEFTVKAVKGQITPDGFARIEADLTALIKSAERRAAVLSVPLPLRELVGQPRDVIEAKWEEMPMAARRDVVAAIFESVTLRYEQRDVLRPRWRAKLGKWNVQVKRRDMYHNSLHKELPEAEAVLARVLAEAPPQVKRSPGTYDATETRIVLKMRGREDEAA